MALRSEPDPPPEAPEVEEISEESGTVTLTWQSNHEDAEVYGDIQYQVEYNRETWDIWLKVCTYSFSAYKFFSIKVIYLDIEHSFIMYICSNIECKNCPHFILILGMFY